MKRGHSTGTKKEKRHAQDWYTARAAELLAQVEATWPTAPPAEPAVRSALSPGTTPPGAKEPRCR